MLRLCCVFWSFDQILKLPTLNELLNDFKSWRILIQNLRFCRWNCHFLGFSWDYSGLEISWWSFLLTTTFAWSFSVFLSVFWRLNNMKKFVVVFSKFFLVFNSISGKICNWCHVKKSKFSHFCKYTTVFWLERLWLSSKRQFFVLEFQISLTSFMNVPFLLGLESICKWRQAKIEIFNSLVNSKFHWKVVVKLGMRLNMTSFTNVPLLTLN